MLRSLYISNYALINELNINFENGFSVITGETGAGKSIILGALSLMLGQRADSKLIKSEAEKCVIEAEFEISNYPKLKDFFTNNDIDDTGAVCIIRRELINSGKSRAFINDTPVSLTLLRDFSIQLIDIHSQFDNLLLSNENYQLEVVDTVANNKSVLRIYTDFYSEWQLLLLELKKLEKLAASSAAELDYIQFQFNQLNESKLIENEQNELESEQSSLLHAEEIKSALSNVEHLLEDENSVLPMFKELISGVSKVKSYIPFGDAWTERLQSCYIELKDIKTEISTYAGKVEFQPDRLEWIEARLSEIYTLQKRYKVNTVAELIEIRDEFDKQLQKIDSFDEEIEKMKSKINYAFQNLQQAAIRLTKSRSNTTSTIETFLKTQLTKLGIPNVQFKVEIQQLADYSPNGKDEICFLFSANKNREVQPVQLVASGGEMSRLMLSIKSLLADKTELPTIIFDEIDTGVSGETAHRVGEIMQLMSKEMQVITITHLPQIAGKSAHHYRVFKDETGKQSQTQIVKLSTEERINEIAQMLSGKNITPAAIQNARELLGIN